VGTKYSTSKIAFLAGVGSIGATYRWDFQSDSIRSKLPNTFMPNWIANHLHYPALKNCTQISN